MYLKQKRNPHSKKFILHLATFCCMGFIDQLPLPEGKQFWRGRGGQHQQNAAIGGSQTFSQQWAAANSGAWQRRNAHWVCRVPCSKCQILTGRVHKHTETEVKPGDTTTTANNSQPRQQRQQWEQVERQRQRQRQQRCRYIVQKLSAM